MLIAPRTVTSKSGNSCAATLLALYIDAPDSLTITFIGLRSKVRKTSATNSSVSREAVPLPIAINSILYFSMRFLSICAAFRRCSAAWCGNTA